MSDLIPKKITDLIVYEESDPIEKRLAVKIQKLFDIEYYDDALLNLWNLAINNIRRRFEAFGMDLVISSLSEDQRKRVNYRENQSTLSERWEQVEDATLISIAEEGKLISKKAKKILETINWMRNHATSAHVTNDPVSRVDFISLLGLIKENLLDTPFPERAFSPNTLYKTISITPLSETMLIDLNEQIQNFNPNVIPGVLGFLTNKIIDGKEPSYSSSVKVFATTWELASENAKRTIGEKYEALVVENTDQSNAAKDRLFNTLIEVGGIEYIPDWSRAKLYAALAFDLKKAKETTYGWKNEESVAKSLSQLGPKVPDSVFTLLYQEILAVVFGNFWGRSDAYEILDDFITTIPPKKKMRLAKMVRDNDRVRSELGQWLCQS